MTTPTPTPAPTQVQHPWRATIRTAVALVPALLVALPEIVNALGVGAIPWVVSLMGVTLTVTRVLALPQVQQLLHTHPWLSWLAATPPASSSKDGTP